METTTITINATVRGYVRSFDAVYANAWNGSNLLAFADSFNCQQYHTSVGPLYIINRGYLSFDTSIIPQDATLVSATLKLYVTWVTDTYTDAFHIQKWYDTASGLTTADWTDWDSNNINYDDGAFTSATATLNAWNSITISNLDIINTNGTTKLCLRTDRDTTSTAPPDDKDSQITANQAQLEITYARSRGSHPIPRKYPHRSTRITDEEWFLIEHREELKLLVQFLTNRLANRSN